MQGSRSRAIRTLLTAITVMLVIAASAVAQIGMYGPSKLHVVRAGVGDPALTNRLIFQCFTANQSTVDRAWAVTYFSGAGAEASTGCARVAFRGVSFVHYAHFRWHGVYSANGLLSCHLPGVPYVVVRGLARSLPSELRPPC